MEGYLDSIKKQFLYYKILGEKAIVQVPTEMLFWQYNEESNSIATIIKHISGNMISRWTDFLITDGEKSWRNRDGEFENDLKSKEEVLEYWEKGWDCFLNAINSITDADLDKIIYIRNMGHTIMEAINRQLAHYPYHIGQIVYIARMIASENWQTLSIAKNKSKEFNDEKFAQEKSIKHFTDDFLKK
ncbi:MAG: DUF1572 domain-containing protein [Thermoflexibacter sp.]|nr:DUF1572 domain-containing protein [Thermoflexibacter sp.]